MLVAIMLAVLALDTIAPGTYLMELRVGVPMGDLGYTVRFGPGRKYSCHIPDTIEVPPKVWLGTWDFCRETRVLTIRESIDGKHWLTSQFRVTQDRGKYGRMLLGLDGQTRGRLTKQ